MSALRMLMPLVFLSLFGIMVEIRSMSFFHHFSKTFNNEAIEQVENLNHELERNYTMLKKVLGKNGKSGTCGSHFQNSPTLTFLCLYASTFTSGSGGHVPEVYAEGEGESKNRKKGQPKEKKAEVSTVPPESNATVIGDVLCMKKKIEPEDEHIHQPIRTISCCQSSGQKCTYDQSDSTRSKYVARCHTKSKESTEYVMRCCEKFGEVVVEPPNDEREARDNKCY